MRRLLIILLAAVSWMGVVSGADAKKGVPTFTKDVAAIIFNKCGVCHRPGEPVPMTLLSYAEIRPWSKAIREVVLDRTMPPWFADPETSLKFRNDRRLSQNEIDTIVAWVDGGSPKGNEEDLPPAPKFTPGWTGGEPDMVIPMPVEFEVPAEGELPMQNFYVPVPFKEDRFVEAVELRPGNPSVVHHSIANVTRLPEGSKIVDGRAIRTGPPGGTDRAEARRSDGLREGREVF
ncbi:MAG TPA: hypothetical protein VNO14_10140, partial [Blastocatellia bacterium]|nr:hypothetical protein [Blastocatellia bacterium]